MSTDLRQVTVLVTGSAGFIGFHVSRSLLGQGAKVIGLDNFNDYYSPALKRDRDRELRQHPNFLSVEGGLADFAPLAALFEEHRPPKSVTWRPRPGCAIL